MRIVDVTATTPAAPWAKVFGGMDRVPPELLRPAANQVDAPRLGQFATIVRVRIDEGLEGIGECYGLPAPEIAATIVSRVIKPMLVGRDPREVEVLWERLYTAQRGAGHNRGFWMEALSGVDIALWDLKGKCLNQPVWMLLGGRFRERIWSYASPVPFVASRPDRPALAPPAGRRRPVS